MISNTSTRSEHTVWQRICHGCRYALLPADDYPVCKAGRFLSVDLASGQCSYKTLHDLPDSGGSGSLLLCGDETRAAC